MSDYVLFDVSCHLKDDAPQQVIDTLKYMTRAVDFEFNNPPDHEFFREEWRCQIWQWMLAIEEKPMKDFPGYAFSKFEYVFKWFTGYKDYYRYILSFRFEMHDDAVANTDPYTFFDWLAPYVDEGFIGCSCSTSSHNPTLIYIENDKVRYWDLDIVDPHSWAASFTFDEVQKKYEQAVEFLTNAYQEKKVTFKESPK